MRVAVFNDTRAGGHYGCDGVMQRLHAGLAARDLHAVFHWPVGRDWRQALDQLPPRGQIDALIVNGEGSIHHSAERPRGLFLAELANLAREHYGVPSFLINATLYRNEAEIYRLIGRFDRVFVRDSGSLDELNRHGVEGCIVPDLTMTLASKNKGPGTHGRKGLGVTDSVRQDISEKLQGLARDGAGQFLPMMRPKRLSLRTRKPYEFLKRLQGRIAFLSESKRRPEDVEAFLRWLEEKELVVTGRFHTVTMCLRTHTPFIAIDSNTPKIKWLLDDAFGDRRRAFETVPELDKSTHQEFSRFSLPEKQKLSEFLRSAEARVESMFDEISETTRAACQS